MGDAMEATPSSAALNLHSFRSEVKELMEIHKSSNEDGPEIAPSDWDKILKDSAQDFENKVKEILSECSDVSFLGIEDLDTYLDQLKEELKTVEAESTKISNEIATLTGTNFEDSRRLESDLEELNFALDLIASQGTEKEKDDANVGSSIYGENQSDSTKNHEDHKFEILELKSQIEKNKIILNSLQDLESIFKRFDAVEQIEDLLAGLKVIDFDGNCFRLSLQTCIPKLGALFQHKTDYVVEPSEVNYELLIEIIDGKMEIKNAEIFPNDVYVGDIIEAAKSFRQLTSQLALLQTSSSLQWFIGKVQDRIILSTLRRLVVKTTNKSRHSFEYLDRDEMVLAHLVGSVDAFIKPSQGWPLLNSPLKLISLKSSDHHSKGISLSFLCKVKEAANSLVVHVRHNLSGFVDAVEKILLEQIRVELHSDSDDTPAK